MSTTPAHLQPRRRRARGPARPQYLLAEDVDPLMHMLIALMGEVSALRDRLDTHELLVAGNVMPTPEAVEAHRPTVAQRAVREQRRQALLKRTLRVLLEQAEAVRPTPVGEAEADAGHADER